MILMFKDVNSFYNAANKIIVGEFTEFICNYNLVNSVVADHICYKASSAESFEKMRRIFEHENKWLYQAIISKRRIATIRTYQSLETSVGRVNLVELSDQKPDGSQVDGFDHLEVRPIVDSYDELVSYLSNRGLEVKEIVRPHHTTHDITLEDGFIVRLTRESLAEKIKSEMNL